MKALTLFQPWATLVAIGAKKIETRSWTTNYRGPLAIHSSKKFSKENRILTYGEEYFRETLMKALIIPSQKYGMVPEDLPCGFILAICDLFVVYRIGNNPMKDGRPISGQERAFGDYTPGRYMWMLGNIKKLGRPIPVKGAMGLWEWNELPEVKR